MTVFVIAMESEASPVLNNFSELTKSEAHGKKIYRGLLCGKECAAVVCGVGKVNAAAGAQYAIDCLGADRIINVGFAGGLNGSVRVGEIYNIGECVQYDFNLAAINGTEIGTLNEYSQPYIPISTVKNYPLRKLGTGDRFNDDRADFLLLTQTLGADIRDMEGGAIAQVCDHAKVPFYSFKAISDVAGAGSTVGQYEQNIALCAQKLEGETENIFLSVTDEKI